MKRSAKKSLRRVVLSPSIDYNRGMKTMNTEHFWPCDQCGNLFPDEQLFSQEYVKVITCPDCTAEIFEEREGVIDAENDRLDDLETMRLDELRDSQEDYWGE